MEAPVLSYVLLGAAIGAVTGIPVGPVNVAVIDAAYRQSLRRAIAVGLGGAIADLVYASLGILGVGPLLDRHPAVPPVLYGLSGVVLIIFGILTARAQELDPHPPAGAEARSAGFAGGVGLGVALILLNPGAIVTWVVIVGSFLAGATTSEGIAAAIGVGLGSCAWFSLVAYLAHHGMKVLGRKAVWLTRVVGTLLVGYGIYSIGRALYYVFEHVL
jgi:L-lysine exporter family protein LysE/ArgO